MLKEVLFYIVVLLSNIIQCITGFAGTVLAMPPSVMLVGYNSAKPILNVLGLLASVMIVIKGRRFINKKELFKIICFMACGMILGEAVKFYFTFEGQLLYRILGITVIAFAVFNAYRFYSKKEDKAFGKAVSFLLLFLSGLVHGLFVCGGPLLVTYLSGKIKDKNEFRSTVSAVWVVLNFIIMLTDISSGLLTIDLLPMLLISAVMLTLAYFIGNLIYEKMSRSFFLQLTYVLMLISGISLLVK